MVEQQDKTDYLKEKKEVLSLEKIRDCLEKMEDLKVLVIGDTIIDHYVFVSPKGRAIKDPILSVGYKYHETYPGGILAVANHLSDFVKKVRLVTVLGDQNDRQGFVKESLSDNVDLKTFLKKDSHTIVKKRFVDTNRNNKLFKIEYMNDEPINEALEKEIIEFLEREVSSYDMVVVGDFGHGFISNAIRRKLEEKSKYMTLNAQSNSANMSYNYFKLYKKFDFITMDEEELRMPLFKRFGDIEEVAKEAYSRHKYNNILVTLGKKGCLYVNDGDLFKAPILSETVTDTVGAGDALFSVTSLFVYLGIEPEIVPFIANCAGGIAVNIMGNKESVGKERFLSFVTDLLE